jgi:translation initiation factor IF-2
MEKIKLHTLAKEYNLENKVLLKIAKDLGISVSSYLTPLDAKSVEKIRQKVKQIKKSIHDLAESDKKKETEEIKEEKQEEKFTAPVAPPQPTEGYKVTEARVKSTVIRRRLQKIEEEPTPPKPIEEEIKVEQEIPEKIDITHPKIESKEKVVKKEPEGLLSRLKNKIFKKEEKQKAISVTVEVDKTPFERDMRADTQVVSGVEDKYAQDKAKSKRVFRKDVEGQKKFSKVFYEPTFRRKKPFHLLKKHKKPIITVPKATKRIIKIEDSILVSELAKRMGLKASEIINKFMSMGLMVTVNQAIEYETAKIVAMDFNYEVQNVSFEETQALKEEEDKEEDLVNRAPVVTVMGHVDHGKTTLLDAIRDTAVAKSEHGGITQKIGAYTVTVKDKKICFIDTPGHEAFTKMRARGAKLTDIVILVVSATDGVMPQTKEAISHAKEASVPIIVVINKIDLAGANPDLIKKQLADLELIPEEWGGDTIYSLASAKTKNGINELLDMILVQAEVLELKTNPKKLGKAIVLESRLDKGRGPVATIIVKDGTLRIGDSIITGITDGKIRAMIDAKGQNVKESDASQPVEIIGLSSICEAGDILNVIKDEKMLKLLITHRREKERLKELAKLTKTGSSMVFDKIKEEKQNQLKIIIKADAQGSEEALTHLFSSMIIEGVKLNVIYSGVGNITESDVMLANASQAAIIGFNIKTETKTKELAEFDNVSIKTFNIIYDAEDYVKQLIIGKLSSTYEEEIMGKASIKEIFNIGKVGIIAGSLVTNGKITKNSLVRLYRGEKVVFTGKISSLKRFKDDVSEVQSAQECGISLENFNDIKPADIIEAYIVHEIKPTLETTFFGKKEPWGNEKALRT